MHAYIVSFLCILHITCLPSFQDIKTSYSKLQARDGLEYEGSPSETSSVADFRGRDMGGKSFNNPHYYDGDSDDGKRFLDSHSGQSGITTALAIAEDSDDCKEVQCIEMGESVRDNGLSPLAADNGEFRGMSFTRSNDGNIIGHELISTPVNGNREAHQIQNNSTNGQPEQRLHDVRKMDINSMSSPYRDDACSKVAADMSSSRSLKLARSWSCRANFTTELSPDRGETTPPHGFDKSFPGRPEGFERKLPQLDFDGSLPRLDSQSSIGSARSIKTSADEDVTRLDAFVAGLKKMRNSECGKELAEGQVRMLFFYFLKLDCTVS